MDQSIDRYMNEFVRSRHYIIWQLIKSYWQSEQRFLAYVFFAIVMILTCCLVTVDVIYNCVYYYCYYALYRPPVLVRFFIVSSACTASYIVFGFYRYYLSQIVKFGWLTEKLITHLKKKRSYFLHKKVSKQHRQSKPKAQEDVDVLVKYSVNMSMCLLGAISNFIFFIYILWMLSGELNISLGGMGKIHISYYLVWIGVVYTIAGIFFTYKFGRPLVPPRFGMQHISAHRGGKNKMSSRDKTILWLSKGYNQAIYLLPLFIAWPNFFDKVYYIVGLGQCLYAFGTIQESLLQVISSYRKNAKSRKARQRKIALFRHRKNVCIIKKSPPPYLKFLSQWNFYRYILNRVELLRYNKFAMCGFYFRE